jgi:hypothetical protein
MMKVIFWNSRCLGDLTKYIYLSEMVKEEQINIIALFEIGIDEFSDKTKEFMWGLSSFNIVMLLRVDQVAYC